VSLRIRFTPEADEQIMEIDEWWRSNRLNSPDLFGNELSRALELISDAPLVGRKYRDFPAYDLRRMMLGSTGYHVYYSPRPGAIWVIAVWHSRRGSGPPLLV